MLSFRYLHPSLAASTRSLVAATRRKPSIRLYGSATVPAERSVLVSAPPPEILEDSGAENLPPEKDALCVVISNRAAEHLQTISKREHDPNLALRVAVESGGCHGYQYKIALTSQREPDDFQFAHPSTQPSNILVDAVSMSLVNGATVDFATELIGSSFRVVENPQAKGSGCGCGVSWEAKI